MDRSIIDQQNSANLRRTRTLPSWLSASTSTSGTAESPKNHRNVTSSTVPTSSAVTIKVEFTECDDDTMSLYSSTNPELVDIKPKVEDIPCSSAYLPVDVQSKVENSSLCSSTKSEPVDIKPEVEDLDLGAETQFEPADVKPNVDDIPIETVFGQEGDRAEFVREDSATTVGSADSAGLDDLMLRDEIVSQKTDPPKECKVESTTQGSTSNIPASVASSPSSPSPVPTSTTTPIPTPSRRMCVYRHKCYRSNLQHKQDFSHPGDVDYDGQPVSDSSSGDPTSKPRCWYGSNCYRKSEEHKQKFYHSPPNSRKRGATRVRPENTNDGDSDAYDDSFIDDDSVEDFGASDDDETEFSDFGGSSSSDEDSYPGPGRSKKKKFNIL